MDRNDRGSASLVEIDAFLRFNEFDILRDAGCVSPEAAIERAETEYEKFWVKQDREFEYDFDREIKKLRQVVILNLTYSLSKLI